MTVRDRLVASAVELIRRDGVSGVGLAALLEHSGVARRSLYLNFPGGKAELMAVAASTAGRLTSSAIDGLADDKPENLIRAFVTGWIQALRATDFRGGCPIVAATLGRTEADAAADAAGEVFTDWTTRIAAHLETEMAAEDAERLAIMAVASVEGAIVMSQATRSDLPLRKVEEGLVAMYRQSSH